MRAKMRDYAFEFVSAFRDKPCAEFLIQPEQGIYFGFQHTNFVLRKGNLILPLSRPHKRAVEGFGSQIRGEERNRVKSSLPGRASRAAQTIMVSLLHCGAASDAHAWAQSANGLDSFADERKGSGNTPDSVVHLGGTVDGDDYFIEVLCDLDCSLEEKQSGAEKGELNIELTEKAAYRRKASMQQGFAAR
jgi:hypothetical protein